MRKRKRSKNRTPIDLWGTSRPPKWDNDSPAVLFELFCRNRDGELSKIDETTYVRMLMHVITIAFASPQMSRSVRETRVEMPDAAQDILAWLVRKTKGGMNLQTQEPLVLMKVLFTSIHRRILDAISDSVRRHGREVTEVDYYHFGGSVQEHYDEKITVSDVPSDETVEESLDEQVIVGSFITKTNEESESILAVCRYMLGALKKQRCLIPFTALPRKFQNAKEVSLELHARIRARIYRHLGELAA